MVLLLFACRNPQDVPGYVEGTAGFLPGGATCAGGAALARRPTGGLQGHPASKALLDSRMRGVQKSVKRPEGPRTMAWFLHQDRRQRHLKRGDFSVACGHEVGSAGTDDELNEAASGQKPARLGQ